MIPQLLDHGRTIVHVVCGAGVICECARRSEALLVPGVYVMIVVLAGYDFFVYYTA